MILRNVLIEMGIFFWLLLEIWTYGLAAAIISVTKCGRRIIKLCSSSKLQPNIKRQSRRKNRFFIIYYVSYQIFQAVSVSESTM
jgi:hypothetical protein